MKHYQILIIGGGTAGLSVAALFRNKPNPPDVAIIEPNDKHYYQPIWTLVGAGVFEKETSVRDEAEYIPRGAAWIKEYADTIDPEAKQVTLRNGDKVSYDYLIVAAGIQINWDKIPGLAETIGKPGSGVCSNYTFETVDSTWENIRNLKSGTALFTVPNTPIKCGGAPMKICFLAAEYWKKHGVRDKIDMQFMKPGAGVFSVKKYEGPIDAVFERNDIKKNWYQNLVEILPDTKEAVFENKETGEKSTVKFDMMHVTPPMSAPDFIAKSPIANAKGWVDVDKYTLQHVKFPTVFSLGDCAGIPASKTGAAIRKQAPVLVENILDLMYGRSPSQSYDGYSSCPIVTGYGKLILAEFDYDQQPMESFPFDQSVERYSMYVLKAYGLPKLYWNGMLRGREF